MGKSRHSNPTSRGRKLRDIAANEAQEDLGHRSVLPVSAARATAKRPARKITKPEITTEQTKPFARDLFEDGKDKTSTELKPYLGDDDDTKDPPRQEYDRPIRARRPVTSKR